MAQNRMAGIRKRTTQPSSALHLTKLTKSLTCIFFLASSLDRILYNHGPSLSCQALSSSAKFTSEIPTTKLESVGKTQFAVLDGAEWKSVQSILKEQQKQTPKSLPSTKYGYMSVLTGKDDKNRRIVAMQCTESDGSSSVVYEDSIAVIPNQVSDEDAISTYIASLSSIVCALPKVENIGGGGDESSVAISGKAVVLGSGDLACFSAEGLASLGVEVFLVNNKGSASVRKNIGKLQVMKPAVGDEETGFAFHLGEFDSMVDTIGNERTSSDDDSGLISFGESTLQLLKSQHKCYNYISTLTNSQDIIANEGMIWGPGKADGYSEKVGSRAFLMSSGDSQSIIPPKSIGSTIEILMKNDIILTEKQRSKACSKKSDAIRGWSLPDFWEQMAWPRDSSGPGTTRFGLPVRDTLDEVEIINGIAVSEPPSDSIPSTPIRKRIEEDETSSFIDGKKKKVVQQNPFVMEIGDSDGFESEIIESEKSCIMFMSARWCRTCKTINPAYNRMARINDVIAKDNNFSFVKAEASTPSGKQLSKLVSVRAVPSFVFVRDGKILGQTYVSKLPDRKISKAVELLISGEEWDESLVDDDEEDDDE